MGKKRDKANEHIVELIDELVDTKFYNLGSNCPYYSHVTRPCENFNHDCSECKEDWKAKETERLLAKYFVE